MTQEPWWKHAVGYQVYPRSFQDSDGDGIGDLRGIIARLDHLQWLGIDVLWISPVYPSPGEDNGYDVSDYCAIDPVFGTLEDFDALVAGVHERGMRIVIDIVVNHTSAEHPWFVESRSSRTNPKRDWYWWRDPAPDGGPPNNWNSRFSGSAWELDPTTEQYYLHVFATGQPDLNWENPEVRAAVHRMMRWWLARGVDGFRLDAINFVSKDVELPDGEPIAGTALGDARPHYTDGPRLVEFLQEIRTEVLDGSDRVLMTVGEGAQMSTAVAQAVTAASGPLDMIFTFEHVTIDYGTSKWDPRPFDLRRLKEVMARWQRALESDGWNSLYWCNHDQPRIVSRWGDDGGYRVRSATALATVLHAHRGTPFVYQGEEIGMTNVEIDTPADLLDIQSRNHLWFAIAHEPATPIAELLDRIRPFARDNGRGPMQWDASPNAGFTDGKPWMPVHRNADTVNVAAAAADPRSVLHHYRALIALRHRSPLLARGSCEVVVDGDERVYTVHRRLDGEQLVMLANLSGDTVELVAARRPAGLTLALGNLDDTPIDGTDLHVLRPWEAAIYTGDMA